MGCTQSKIENEESVARCKERKQFMKTAVSSRNAFAAAHSSYSMSLKNTGAALSDYALGEHHDLRSGPSSSSSSAPQTSSASVSAGAAVAAVSSSVKPPIDNLPPPPPLPDHLAPVAPLHRAASMPGLPISAVQRKKSTHDTAIIEEDDPEGTVDESETDVVGESSAAPPAPPAPAPKETRAPPPNPNPRENWDYFDIFNTEHIPAPSLGQPEESVAIGKEAAAAAAAAPAAAAVVVKDPMAKVADKGVAEGVPTQQQKGARKQRQGGGSSHHHRTGSSGGGAETKRGKMVAAVPQSVNFLQILKELDDHFLKAHQSAREVSKMLEATRMHYHSNFADNRGDF